MSAGRIRPGVDRTSALLLLGYHTDDAGDCTTRAAQEPASTKRSWRAWLACSSHWRRDACLSTSRRRGRTASARRSSYPACTGCCLRSCGGDILDLDRGRPSARGLVSGATGRTRRRGRSCARRQTRSAASDEQMMAPSQCGGRTTTCPRHVGCRSAGVALAHIMAVSPAARARSGCCFQLLPAPAPGCSSLHRLARRLLDAARPR